MNRPLHCRLQPNQVALEDVVARAVLQRSNGVVLPDCSGKEYKWNFRMRLSHDGKCRHAVELRHAEIGKDDMGFELAELAPQILFAVHAPCIDDEASARQLPHSELGVRLQVLNQ